MKKDLFIENEKASLIQDLINDDDLLILVIRKKIAGEFDFFKKANFLKILSKSPSPGFFRVVTPSADCCLPGIGGGAIGVGKNFLSRPYAFPACWKQCFF